MSQFPQLQNIGSSITCPRTIVARVRAVPGTEYVQKLLAILQCFILTVDIKSYSLFCWLKQYCRLKLHCTISFLLLLHFSCFYFLYFLLFYQQCFKMIKLFVSFYSLLSSSSIYSKADFTFFSSQIKMFLKECFCFFLWTLYVPSHFQGLFFMITCHFHSVYVSLVELN